MARVLLASFSQLMVRTGNKKQKKKKKKKKVSKLSNMPRMRHR